MSTAWGKYELGERIGCGGMAEVFEAELRGAAGFRRPVAIKRVHPTFSADPAFAERFVVEAVLTSQLDHPNVVSVLDFDRDEEGRLFLVMERVRGPDLRGLMGRGRVPVPVAVHVAAELLRALRHAHELGVGNRRGVLHRDISPHNVLLSWDGAVKLTDFGIAKAAGALGASASGRVRGKLGYMSPEQAQGLRLDARSDLFAVGVVLHELLTGRRLFQRGPMADVLSRLLAGDVPRPSAVEPAVPELVEAVVMRLLARDREARYGSAREALTALRATGAASPEGADAVAAALRDRFPGEPARDCAVAGREAAEPATVATACLGPPRAETTRGTLTGTTGAAQPRARAGAVPRRAPARTRRSRRALVSLALALARGGAAGRR